MKELKTIGIHSDGSGTSEVSKATVKSKHIVAVVGYGGTYSSKLVQLIRQEDFKFFINI